jgi:glycerol kinase
MGAEVVLAIDQGTTNSKAVLVSQAGKILAKGSSPVQIHFPKPGWVEQDAGDIWSSVLSAIYACIAEVPEANIIAIGISNQRESVVAWNRVTGDILGPVISWQCRRTTDATKALKASGAQQKILEVTGLPIDPLFPSLKIRWLLDHAHQSNDICVGTIDSWLIYKLTGGIVHATDRSNASRTQLLNIAAGEWDPDLCELLEVPASVLPQVCDSSNIFGTTLAVPGLQDGLPIASAIGDSHAALFGHSAFNPGDAKITFGTGSSVMVNLPDIAFTDSGLTTTIAWSINGKSTYAFEGNILVSASIFPWAAEMLGLGEGSVDQLLKLAQTAESSEGVFLIPAHVGLGAPHWRPDATGLISGLRFSTKPAHVARAAAESMALQVVDVLESISDQLPDKLGSIGVDGGPTNNRFLMQLVANFLERPIHTSGMAEISALGAAALAGLASRMWSSLEELAALERQGNTIKPEMEGNERAIIIQGWKKAVSRCIV